MLHAASRSDADAKCHEQLWSLIYDQLRAVAGNQMAAEGKGRTLQPTALVHEAYVRLLGGQAYDWANRKQFFAAAAKAMRRIRVDDARRRKRLKRAAGKVVSLDDSDPAVFDQDPSEVLEIDDALNALEAIEPRAAEVVLQRYFVGLTVAETADVLGVSERTVEYDWRFAKSWLHRALRDGAAPDGDKPR